MEEINLLELEKKDVENQQWHFLTFFNCEISSATNKIQKFTVNAVLRVENFQLGH